MTIQEHIPLAPRTTFKVGGIARYLITATTPEEIQEAIAFANNVQLPTVILGGGSNMLIDDGLIEAVFVHPSIKEKTITPHGLYILGAGESWDAAVSYAVTEGLWGLENLSGIPGSVGAAPVQNIGAYGSALEDHLLWVEALHRKTNTIERIPKAACAFGYRDSMFKQQEDAYVILRVAFTLATQGTPNISYKDLAQYFEGKTPSLNGVRSGVLSIRAKKFPDLSKEGTAGSFFKNPIVSPAEAARLKELFPDWPQFPGEEGVKLPLAWALDKLFSLRGYTEGYVRAFEEQPLVLVASEHASAKEVRMFAARIKALVKEKTNIVIEPEVCIMHGARITRDISY